jgi:hypothetical protein
MTAALPHPASAVTVTTEGGVRDDHSAAAAIAARVERHTVRPVAPPAADPLDVVVVLPDGELQAAFELARDIARSKGTVRLVAHGATLPCVWPAWVSSEPGLVLSELGAYRAGNVLEATSELRSTYRDWIDDVFAKAAPAGAAAHVYYAAVCVRLFQATFESQIFVSGIRAVHASSRLHLVGEERRAVAALMGTTATFASRVRELTLPMAIAAAWFGASAFTLAECVRMRRDARASLEAIAARRATAHPQPAMWVGLVPDWDRMNKHLLDAGAKPELSKRGRLGVLLLGTLRGGKRDEHKLKAVLDPTDLWAGLSELRADLDRCSVTQAVQPTTDAAYVRAVAAAFQASASVALRMILRPGPLTAFAEDAGVLAIARRAASAATLDVARSVLAERAAREVITEHDVRGKVVALAAAQAAGYTSAEWILREAGAITVEHTHGSGGNEFYGACESTALVQCLWTVPETRELGRVRRCVIGGMPDAIKLRPRRPGRPRRVLLLSNYVHRDRTSAALPSEPFQTELLRVPVLLRAALGDDLEFRWRPHPADEDGAVARGLARVPFVTLSRNRPLADDLDACDVLISGRSTALIEAVVAGVPFFVHAPPGMEPDVEWAPAERRFFHAEDVVAPFIAWADALAGNSPEASDADRRARLALFGPSARPRSFHDAVESLMASSEPQ